MKNNLIVGLSLLFFLFLSHQVAHAATPMYTETTPSVHYNWGLGGPPNTPVDNFTARFDQSQNLSSGDYFLQTFADDGVTVDVDGKRKIDRWYYSSQLTNRALLPNMSSGEHQIITNYHEISQAAAIFSDVVHYGDWLAYYYPNDSLQGYPTAANVVKATGPYGELYQDNGYGSPAPNIPSDYFSASYVTAKHLPAGDYLLRARADDGIQVFVDGKLVIDRFTPSSYREDAIKLHISDRTDTTDPNLKDVHWIEIHYKEITGTSKVDFVIQPYSDVTNLTTSDGWLGEVYPSEDFSGNPVVLGERDSLNTLSNIDFNWGNGSPSPLINSNNFSGKFFKKINIDSPGSYILQTWANSGAKVYVDGTLILDAWNSSINGYGQAQMNFTAGVHTIEVDYHEHTGNPYLKFNMFQGTDHLDETLPSVHYMWGTNAPNSHMPPVLFKANFDQSQYLSGDYFIQTLADDGVQVDVDGNRVIDRPNYSSDLLNQAILTNLNPGNHSIMTHYYQGIGNAFIYSDVVPFGNWLAYYYPNENTDGNPTASKVIQASGPYGELYQDNGYGGPIDGPYPSDHFSAKYFTVKRIPAGDYVLRARADDGIQVYLDGKLVIDRFTPSSFSENAIKLHISDRTDTSDPNLKDVHNIMIRYKEITGLSKVEFFIQPFSDASNLASTDGWLAQYFPNETLSGNAVVDGGENALTQINNLDFNWGYGSPDPSIPSQHFSARFTKTINVTADQAGPYTIRVWADDGVVVNVDGNTTPVINSWKYVPGDYRTTNIWLSQGTHTIQVDYVQFVQGAFINFDLLRGPTQYVSQFALPVYNSFSDLSTSVSQAKSIDTLNYGDQVIVQNTDQYGAQIKTLDGKVGWVQKDYLSSSLDSNWWYVKDARHIRSNPGVNYPTVGPDPGMIQAGDKVKVLMTTTVTDPTASSNGLYTQWDEVETTDGTIGWIWGALTNQPELGYDLIRYNFDQQGQINDNISVFTPLNTASDVTAPQINSFISSQIGSTPSTIAGEGDAFITAQKLSGLNAIYLLSHAILETGWGTSNISSTKYNFYGINVTDANPNDGYNYSSPSGGIIEGANWISQNYLNWPYPQPTLDSMRNDNGTHQYATDDSWAEKISSIANGFYNFITGH